ncbi:MAG: hypothetical protein IKK24_03015 [Clostridia bacterium]|nr:hypothetical protein [Clostridia bacterium]
MSHIGRPKSDNPKSVKMNIRITKETANDLEACATVLNTSKIAVIEKGIGLVKKEVGIK